ncbi:MAG: SUMF1/EgtB/PvdO family nonheme iron enzyme [Cyanobacteria bacterium P01_F01_bin.86]
MGKNWAITIGINEYRYLQRLNYAKQDADAVRQLFLQDLGFQQVYHFTDNSPDIPQDYGPDLESRPSATTLGRFLRTRFETPFLREGDNLWFFFAGHGMRNQNRDYLMPIDGDRGDLARSAIPIHYVSECLRRSGADNVILLIDACRSFEGRRDGVGIGLEKQQGVITLFSCSPEESAYEIAELQQGAFTHVLLESLRRQGEGNCATVERLYQQLRYYVPQLTRQYKRVPQTPYGVIEPPTKNHLILLPQRATLADIVTLKNDALRAEVQRDFKQAKQYWVQVLTASPADPEAIEGIERLSRLGGTPPSSSPLPEPKPINSTQAKPRAATPSVPRPSNSRSVAAPQPKPRRSVITPPRPTSSAGLPISRRRAVQLLGFTGGGVGVLLLGRAIQQSQPEASAPPLTAADFVPFEYEVVTVNEMGAEVSRETQQGKVFREAIGDGFLEMVPISGGEFMMGQTEAEKEELLRQVGEDNYQTYYVDELPQRPVTVSHFLLGKYPVTQAQYQAVMGKNPSRFTENGANRPVEHVSWDDAVAFCQALSKQTGREYRLPSEAEWEYACRADTTTPFHFGPTITTDIANYDGDYTYSSGPKGQYRQQTTEVGSFPANAFGLYDMHGNVWEWCLDHWHDSYEGAPTDGRPWLSSDENAPRLLRGGSWVNHPGDCRAANRIRLARVNRSINIGFRVVCASSWALS